MCVYMYVHRSIILKIFNFLALPDIKLPIIIYNAASDWPLTVFIAKVFLFKICI